MGSEEERSIELKEDKGFSRRSFLRGAMFGGAAMAGMALAGCAPTQSSNASSKGLADTGDAVEAAGEPVRGIPVILQGEQYDDGAIYDADLLIIGSGYAGLWALMSAHEQGVTNIAVMDKGAIGQSSVASLTLGTSGFVCPSEGHDIDATTDEMIRGADYLSRQDIWKAMMETSEERYNAALDMGINYAAPHGLTSDGNKELKLTGGTSYVDSTGTERVCGKAVVSALIDQVKDFDGVTYFSKTMATQLLKEGDRVVGAVGVNRMTGNTVAIRAKATIVATGQCAFRGQHAITEVETGDGYQLVWDAGGTLNNLEFNTFDIDPAGFLLEGGSILCEMGCVLQNAEGNEFMDAVDPVLKSAANIVHSSRGMAMEVAAGRGPIVLNRDTELFGEVGQNEHWAPFLPPGSWQGENEARFPEIGIDLVKEPLEFTANSFGIIGAIVVNADCSTEIPGLFGASIAISHDPGKIKGVESMRAWWSGKVAGATAAQYAAASDAPTLSDGEIAALTSETNALIGRKGALTANELTRRMQRSLFDYRVGILKTEESLTQALDEIRACKDVLGEVAIDDAHELVKYYELRNMLTVAELHLMASIDRKETRVCHLRLDYPQRNDGEWLKWIEWKKGEDGKPVKSYRDVPLADYPVQPDPNKGLNATVNVISA